MTRATIGMYLSMFISPSTIDALISTVWRSAGATPRRSSSSTVPFTMRAMTVVGVSSSDTS